MQIVKLLFTGLEPSKQIAFLLTDKYTEPEIPNILKD
jgi:hypothetical protein